MMNRILKAQTVKKWMVEKFFKDAEIFANWENKQIILKTDSKDFPYAEIIIRPLTEEVGNNLIIEVLEQIKSYEEHKRNRFIAKLMGSKEK